MSDRDPQQDEPLPKVRDLRSSQTQETDFHRAVVQMVLHPIGLARDKRHLAALAKAQAVTARVVRRIITRGELSNREPVEFSPAEVMVMVLEEDKADEVEGTGR